MKHDEMVRAIGDRVIAEIPEGVTTEDEYKRIEILLGRLANDYAYVVSMASFARNYVRQLKRNKEKDAYEDMMDKRDSLEAIASAVKIQYQAVSRMLTVKVQAGEEMGMYGYRKEQGR